MSILYSPNNKDKRLGLNVAADWASALDLLKKYKELKTDMTAADFYTNDFVPESVDRSGAAAGGQPGRPPRFHSRGGSA